MKRVEGGEGIVSVCQLTVCIQSVRLYVREHVHVCVCVWGGAGVYAGAGLCAEVCVCVCVCAHACIVCAHLGRPCGLIHAL